MTNTPPPRRYVDTPRTDKAAFVAGPPNDRHDVVHVAFAEQLESQLKEARALLTRISDGAEPVLMAEEIEEFLDKTEIDN